MSLDKNEHLREVLDTHKMCHIQNFVDKVKRRREEVKAKMSNRYGSDNIRRLVLVVLLNILLLM